MIQILSVEWECVYTAGLPEKFSSEASMISVEVML